jgi:hypothetical protein
MLGITWRSNASKPWNARIRTQGEDRCSSNVLTQKAKANLSYVQDSFNGLSPTSNLNLYKKIQLGLGQYA